MADYFIAKEGGSIGAGTYRGLWSNSQTWAVGDKVSPSTAYATAAARGYIYECTTGGAGGASEPTWVYTTPDTSTTTSSSAVFTCRNPDTWAKAGVYLDQGLQRATTAGDRVVIQYDGVPAVDTGLSADTTYTIQNSISIIASTNSGTSTITPTAMGTGGAANCFIGSSTASVAIAFAANAINYNFYVYGLTLRNGGSSGRTYSLSNSQMDAVYEGCHFWMGHTSSAGYIQMGTSSATVEVSCLLKNCTVRYANASHRLVAMGGRVVLEGVSIASSGTAPSGVFTSGNSTGTCDCIGCDFSYAGSGTIVPDQTSGFKRFTFTQCKFGASAVVMAAQTTNPTIGACEVYVYDCNSGDNHYGFGYYNAYGEVVADATIYANDGAEYQTSGTGGVSWKITSTANANIRTPFVTPWISVHHEGTSAITPYLECLRDGSATAYQNDELWAEFMFKGTSGYTLGTIDSSDRVALAGTAADQTSSSLGASDWTGENATAWFGKLSPTASITPAELGDLCARVCFQGEGNVRTVYVDPTIRGRS